MGIGKAEIGPRQHTAGVLGRGDAAAGAGRRVIDRQHGSRCHHGRGAERGAATEAAGVDGCAGAECKRIVDQPHRQVVGGAVVVGGRQEAQAIGQAQRQRTGVRDGAEIGPAAAAVDRILPAALTRVDRLATHHHARERPAVSGVAEVARKQRTNGGPSRREGVFSHRQQAGSAAGKRRVVDRRHGQRCRGAGKTEGGVATAGAGIGSEAHKPAALVPGLEADARGQRAVPVGVGHETHPSYCIGRQQARAPCRRRPEGRPAAAADAAAVLPRAVAVVHRRHGDARQCAGVCVAHLAGDQGRHQRAGIAGVVFVDGRHHIGAGQDRRVVGRGHQAVGAKFGAVAGAVGRRRGERVAHVHPGHREAAAEVAAGIGGQAAEVGLAFAETAGIGGGHEHLDSRTGEQGLAGRAADIPMERQRGAIQRRTQQDRRVSAEVGCPCHLRAVIGRQPVVAQVDAQGGVAKDRVAQHPVAAATADERNAGSARVGDQVAGARQRSANGPALGAA